MRARRSKRLWKAVFGSIRRVPKSRAIGHRGLGQPLRPLLSSLAKAEAKKIIDRTKGRYGQSEGQRH